jgi:hypothetical protein
LPHETAAPAQSPTPTPEPPAAEPPKRKRRPDPGDEEIAVEVAKLKARKLESLAGGKRLREARPAGASRPVENSAGAC